MTTSLARASALGLAVLWGILGVAASGSRAADDEQSREALRGLAGVHVVVEDLNPNAEQAGLTRAQIRTDVELRLWQAGIPVLTRQETLRGGDLRWHLWGVGHKPQACGAPLAHNACTLSWAM